MKNLTRIALSAVTIALLSGCGDTTVNQSPSDVTIIGDTTTSTATTSDGTTDTAVTDSILDAASLKIGLLVANIATDMTLTNDTLWQLDGQVVVMPGVTLTIEPGTIIAGLPGTADNASWLLVDAGAKIMADGTAEEPIIFTSQQRVDYPTSLASKQWGGLTIIGNAGNSETVAYEVDPTYGPGGTDLTDSSGILRHVKVLNSGAPGLQDKELNGLSMLAVGSGTVVENITVDYSGDDGVELWGGAVNLTNVTITNCEDDYLDLDDAYTGTIKNLVINATTGYSAIEMSGSTLATIDGFTITTSADQIAEGGLYFKDDKVGGTFKNGTIIHNGKADGAIHAKAVDDTKVSFENVGIVAGTDLDFTGTEGALLATVFNNTGDNSSNCTIPTVSTLAGDITGCTVLTADQIWELSGKVLIPSGSSLRIQQGTTVAGQPGTADNASWLLVDAGAKIHALGTETAPIAFTSTAVAIDGDDPASKQWGGLTIIGNAGNSETVAYEVDPTYGPGGTDLTDSSGILRHVKVLNSGAPGLQDKELNGLSMLAVGSGTVVENITVDYSGDDGVELWGGAVNLTNVTITNCEDDYLDLDDAYTGTIKNLVINATTGYSAIEMSGSTLATIDGFTITTSADQIAEGGLYFKDDKVGGTFKNGTIIHNGKADGAIHARLVDDTKVIFENVAITTGTDLDFTGDEGALLETVFNAGSGNTVTYN